MKIIENYEVPTGNILIVGGEKGKLECLSIADYGKDVNLKADFLGLEREPSPVRHTKLLPLEEKWVVTISTQYGCSMRCNFCDVPAVGNGKNATFRDLILQTLVTMSLHLGVKRSDRLNVHFARMGEPTWNLNVLDAARWMHNKLNDDYNVHPVVSTMMPKNNKNLKFFIEKWMSIKNYTYAGNAGLQLSINSTSSEERDIMFGGSALELDEIGEMMQKIPAPIGRKITLNFAVADYEIDPTVLLKYFNPSEYLVKLTPMHKTTAAGDNGILTSGDYTTFHPYQKYEESLKNAGYDVIVFIASVEEDLGRITCGNAILSGTKPEVEFKIKELK